MRKCIIIFVLSLLCITATPVTQAIWIDGYYPGWTQDRLKPADVDYSAVTHIMHHAVLPRSDGTLDTSINVIDRHIAETVSATHAAGKKILIVIGGSNSNGLFNAATTPAVRPQLVSNLVTFIKTNGYDGVDVDWEPTPASDKPQFDAFIRELHAALRVQIPGSLLTAAVFDNAEGRAIVQGLTGEFDQINVMTYVLSGPWGGWVTWYNSPLYNGGRTFPSTGGPLPSIDLDVDRFITAGVPKEKLGIGAELSGVTWTGSVSGPRQSYTTDPQMNYEVPYYDILSKYYQTQYFHFDPETQVPYLGIDHGSTTQNVFLSYENETSLTKKVEYIKTKGIGGIIIWQLDHGYLADKPAGQRDPLLKAVKAAGLNSCSTVQGDANGDSQISIIDFTVWRKAFIDQRLPQN